MNVFEKVQIAKERILKANLKKSGRNAFANYTYYELSDLLPTIIQICRELKLFTKVTFDNDYATLTIINIEKPEETIEYTSPMKELNLKGANPVQALGGVETYQRRYLYMSAFDIIENDMFDGADPEKNKPVPQQEKPKVTSGKATTETLATMNKAISTYAKAINKEEALMKKTFIEKIGAKDETTLTEEQAVDIITRIKKQLERMKK